MHEYSIVEALIERVGNEVRARGASAVHRLTLRVGELSGVDLGLLTTAYETFRERTICAAAVLEVQGVAARWQCKTCGQLFARGEVLHCQRCAAPAVLVAGDEIILDQIDMEVA